MSNEVLKSVAELQLSIDFIKDCFRETEALVSALAAGKSLSGEAFSESAIRIKASQLQKTIDSAYRLLKAYEDIEIQHALCADEKGKKLFGEFQTIKKEFESLRCKIIGTPLERLHLEKTLSSAEGLLEVIGSTLLLSI